MGGIDAGVVYENTGDVLMSDAGGGGWIGGIWSDTSSWGSSFMAFCTLSPATVDAQRFRDMSASSSVGSTVPLTDEPNAAMPFMCVTGALSRPVLAGGELWLEGAPPAGAACGEPFNNAVGAMIASLTDRFLSMSDTHVRVFFSSSTMFAVCEVCPFDTASLPVLAATATLWGTKKKSLISTLSIRKLRAGE